MSPLGTSRKFTATQNSVAIGAWADIDQCTLVGKGPEPFWDLQKMRHSIWLKLSTSELAAQRVSNFDPYISGAFQCPRRWIEDGRRLRIVTVPSKALGELNTYHCSPVITK